MSTMKLQVEKFTENDDFGLWRIKMRALLIQHGFGSALQEPPTEASSEAQAKRKEIDEKAHSAIIL